MNNNPAEMLPRIGPIQSIRDVLAAYLKAEWPEAWPIYWQNMPISETIDHQDVSGWVQCHVMVETIRPMDIGRIRHLARGRLYIVATALKDTGMTQIDDMADKVLDLFAGQHIQNVKIGSISLEHPRYDGGYVQMGITITFTTIVHEAT